MDALDFVKKFASLHKSYTPNEERDLYSASPLPLSFFPYHQLILMGAQSISRPSRTSSRRP